MSILFVQVDAFSHQLYRANPAAVCRLDEPADADWMQAVAVEINVSETAFVSARNHEYDLRWFTPSTEVDLRSHGQGAPQANRAGEMANKAFSGVEVEFTESSRATARKRA